MKPFLLALALGLSCVRPGLAAIPAPEKILPADTLAVVTAPDFASFCEQHRKSPQLQFWHDPAMKPFIDKIMARLQTELIEPLERDLGGSLSNYTALAQGQMTFAVVQNGWQGTTNVLPGWLFLLDTKTNRTLLETNLTTLKRKWTDAGKPLKTETIRGVEFTTLLLSSNDLAGAMKKMNPAAAPETFKPDDPAPAAPPTPLYLGQHESLFIAGNSTAVIEKILRSLNGGSAPVLADEAAFEASRGALFRDATAYGWIHTKPLMEILVKVLAHESETEPNTTFSLVPFSPDKAITSLGLNRLRTVAFSMKPTAEGSTAELLLAIPESDRQDGIFKILAGEPRETTPPAFVPADAVKFTRFRLNGPQSWENLEKMLGNISPNLPATINILFSTASMKELEKNPDYDLKKIFLDSLGDDFISYQKAPRSQALADVAAPPSIFLVGSPQPDKLLEALKSIFALINRRGDPPTEREFLGHKIYTITTTPAQLVTGEKTGTRAASFAAANGYCAISMDAATLEEFLRSGENPGKALRETPGLAAAIPHVRTAGASYFNYENQRETMRTAFDMFKQLGAASKPGVTDPLGMLAGQNLIKDWIDVALLPDFSRVAKYFGLTVSAMSATPTGLSMKVFAPTPEGITASPAN